MKNQDYPFYRAKLFYNLKDFIFYCTSLYDRRVAFAYEKEEKLQLKTYSQLWSEIQCLGAELMKLIGTKQKVAVIGENSYEWILVYLATVCSRKRYCTN